MQLTRLAIVLALTACAGSASSGGGRGSGSGSGSGGKGDGGGLTASQFLTRMGMSDCDQAFACKSTFPTDQGTTFEQVFGASQSACYADASPADELSKVASEISAGKIHFDANAAATCVAGITAPDCATLWTNGPTYPSACGTALVGTVADGGACVVDYDCSNVASVCLMAGTCGPDPQGQRIAPSARARKELLETL